MLLFGPSFIFNPMMSELSSANIFGSSHVIVMLSFGLRMVLFPYCAVEISATLSLYVNQSLVFA
jgi:hypothetical protein